jgi:predicted molibdopterin-dependent oxidoreductase YjgC
MPRSVSIDVDGVAVAARAGDTLLSVLLRERGYVRRAEFGNPDLRAGFCLMGGCQDCWISLAGGERVRACTTLARDGMKLVTDDCHD